MIDEWVHNVKRVIVVGAVNNLFFAAAGNALQFLQAIIVMRIIGPESTGLLAMALAIGLTLDSLSDFGINDRLVQVSDDGVRGSYTLALTTQLALGVLLWLAVYLSAPGLARFYHQPELEPLVRAIGYMALGGVARLPVALLYRELRFFEQRLTIFLGRLAGFAVTVAFAAAGAGVWSVVYGGAVMLTVTAAIAWWYAPYVPEFRFRLSELRPLLNFSIPVWLSKITYVLIQQGAVMALSVLLTVGDVGQFKSAEQLASLVFYLEIVLGQTIFPVLCRMAGSDEFLSKAFVTATRVSMVWIGAASAALVLFAGDIVRWVLTPEWSGAELFLQAQGLALLFGATLSSWDALFKARNDTGPILRMALIFFTAFVFVFVPLVFFFGRAGAAAGTVLLSATTLAGRVYYLRRLSLAIYVSTIMTPALVAVMASATATLGVRALVPAAGIAGLCLQVVVFATTYGAVWLRLEGTLLRSVINVITQPPPRLAVAPGPAAGKA